MRAEIILPNGDLKREVWEFELVLDFSGRNTIYLSRYSFQTKETTRHKWKVQTNWDRLFRRSSNIETPTIPIAVEEQVRHEFIEIVRKIPITM